MISKFLPIPAWLREILSEFSPHIKAERLSLLMLVAITAITTTANALLIWKMGAAISQLSGSQFDELDRTLIEIALIVLVAQGLRFFYVYHHQQISLGFVDRLRGRLLEHILSLSTVATENYRHGDLLSRLTNDVDRLLTFVVNAPLNVASSAMIIGIYLPLLFWIDWKLASTVVAISPVFFLSQYFVAPRTREASRRFVEERANLIAIEEQALANLKGISAFNAETIVRAKHGRQFRLARHWARKMRRIRALYNTSFTLLLYLAGVVVVYGGIYSIKSGSLAVGGLVSFLIYVRNLAGPARNLARMPVQLQMDRIAAERVMAVLRTPLAVNDVGNGVQLRVFSGEIAFKGVCFAYPNGATIFSGLSVTIRGGKTVAIVGPSGVGKSTLARLLLRFHDPTGGAIYIDGTDIRGVSLKSLRSVVSIVWQEPFLMNGTIRENLLLARPSATEDQLIDACRNSFCWEYIERLDGGLDTMIGAKGTMLSTGQKQRLAIAQAFLRDSPILILDEATSALDSHSEKALVTALDTLRKSRTTLIIAHRFSSIRSADGVLYLSGDGKAIFGAHEELLQQQPGYKDAVEWQTSISKPAGKIG